jgi:hypothetical protein
MNPLADPTCHLCHAPQEDSDHSTHCPHDIYQEARTLFSPKIVNIMLKAKSPPELIPYLVDSIICPDPPPCTHPVAIQQNALPAHYIRRGILHQAWVTTGAIPAHIAPKLAQTIRAYHRASWKVRCRQVRGQLPISQYQTLKVHQEYAHHSLHHNPTPHLFAKPPDQLLAGPPSSVTLWLTQVQACRNRPAPPPQDSTPNQAMQGSPTIAQDDLPT